jgi:hypothetical protein
MGAPLAPEPIATRTYRSPAGPDVLLRIYPPVPASEPGGPEIDWSCRVVIEGLDEGDLDRHCGGIDSLQALVNALTHARSALYRNTTPLRFLELESLGLPIPEPMAWTGDMQRVFTETFQRALFAALGPTRRPDGPGDPKG